MADLLEKGASRARGAGSPAPQKLKTPDSRNTSSEGSTNPPQTISNFTILFIVLTTALLVFGGTVFYYQSILHIETLDMQADGARHPMVRNELLKKISPSFNEFAHFSEKGKLQEEEKEEEQEAGDDNAPISRKESTIDVSSHEEEKEEQEQPGEVERSDPDFFASKKAEWDAQDTARFTRMTAKRKQLEENQKNGKELPKHHLTCPGKELVEFWSDSTLDDWAYETPYTTHAETKYVTFEPDVGGWNNIRMQMELVLVFAAASGRTLVLPPDQPMYLLNKGKGKQQHHSFADFFPFEYIATRVPVISMKEFIDLEAQPGNLFHNKNHERTPPPPGCDGTSGVDRDKRNQLWEYLRNVSSCPPWKGMKDYLVIPPRPGMNTTTDLPPAEAADYDKRSQLFAGDKRYGMDRKPKVYDKYWHEQKVIHFISKPAWGYRLLEHFYTYIHFQDPAMDRFYKRFVRDYVHYVDLIFCKSAQIIQALLKEGDGVYSSFHVRRGEFQYKNVKIPAADMLANIGDKIPKDRLVFIATDERNKAFFDAFKARWPKLKFLDDYMDMAQLKDINPNFLGMIDATVCTRGEQFIGTWFSTFSGYITRMRGYMNYPDETNWYADKEHMNRFQQYEYPRFPFYMRENSISWYGIDEDHKDYWEKYFIKHPFVKDEDPWKKKNKNKNKNGNAAGKNGGGNKNNKKAPPPGQLQKGQGKKVQQNKGVE